MVHLDVNATARRPLRAVFAVATGLLLASPSLESAERPGRPAAVHWNRLKPGDIVFRSGRGWRADAVRLAGDAPWSHVGIIVGEPGTGWKVIHAEPPEGASPGGVLTTPLAEFADRSNSRQVAYYRFVAGDPAKAAAAAAAALRTAGAHIAFDESFDLESGQSLYCTELVLRVFTEAGMDLRAVPSRVSIGGLGGKILLPEDLLKPGKLVRVG